MAIVLTQPQPSAPHLHPSPLISSKPLPTPSNCPHDTPSSPQALSLTSIAPPSKSRPPPLPAELHLQIINSIANRIPHTPSRDEPYDPTDLEALCTCSLVCKLWMNIARVGIWAGVRLSGRRKSMAFVKLLKAYACGAEDSRSRMHMPSFGFYVVHLSLRETRGNAWDPKWLNDALPTLAAHLPRVHSLEMERVTWEYLSARSRAACLKAFKHATTLTLRGFAFHTSRDMCNFLAEFDDLKVLTLDGVHCAKMNTPRWFLDCSVDGERVVKSPPRMLKEVGVRGALMGPILEWILASFEYQKEVGRHGHGITSVRLGGVGVGEAGIIGKFLRGVGESLRKVHIGFDTDFIETGDRLVSQIDLAQNTNLEEFHIFGLVVPSPPPIDPFEQDPTPPQRTLTHLTSLLSQIRSPMRVLSLALYPADLRAISTIDFEGLAEVFEKPMWSCLDEVRVVISNKGEYGLGKAAIERLGALNERGVLKINVGFDEREVL
ncbi:hypothetical protein BDN67DRAFT_1001318 [Paxillus ammoniavirescens]|nr:hypothetical protein BDN67DRAFT_1001318 [Paxillus ammoniavirescens]